jgi:cytoskeletal protein CcmA (bactofilin family)
MASNVKAGNNTSHAKIKIKPIGDTVMANDDYEFYVGSESILEGAALEINGTARIDGMLNGKVKVKHLIIGKPARVQGDIQSETADIEGTVEDSIEVEGKLTIRKTGRVRGKISYGSLETEEGAKLIGEVGTNWDAEWDSESVEEVENNDRLSSLVNSMNDNSSSLQVVSSMNDHVDEPNPEDDELS